jgi:aspartate carbamoyltransferase regulatory subunit
MRASRKIKKAMRLDPARFKKDTIIIRDTVIVKSVQVDTVTSIEYHDTIKVIDNSKVVLKYFYDSTTREIWHEVECKGDTVFIENEIIVEKVTTGNQKQCIIWIVLLALFGVYIFFVGKT